MNALQRPRVGCVLDVLLGLSVAVIFVCLFGLLMSSLTQIVQAGTGALEGIGHNSWLRGALGAAAAMFLIRGIYVLAAAFKPETVSVFDAQFWIPDSEAHGHPHLYGAATAWTSVCWVAFLLACQAGLIIPPSMSVFPFFAVCILLQIVTHAPVLAIKWAFHTRVP
jgi:hypothetical protein